MRKIDTGNSSFEKLITQNNLYIDKTKYLYSLLTDGETYYFLSRPRRFGKSLTLSTLEAVFKGKRSLFKGLYIDQTDYDWKEYPVMHIDFGLCGAKTGDDFSLWLNNKLDDIAFEYGIDLPPSSYYTKLDRLISALARKAPVVILVDEYDKMLSNSIYSEEMENVRDVERTFFEVIKAKSSSLRFVLITGITKFSKVSIFSSMNNLTDISLTEKYATMFGYTQKELEDNFVEYIKEGMEGTEYSKKEYLARIKRWYNGYLFSPESETVYNPVSVGTFFSRGGKGFDNYWINTGGMTYLLTETAKRVRFDISLDTEITVSSDILQATDIVQMARTEVSKRNFLSLLYQSGYLTIKQAKIVGDSYLFTLGYPNEEVRRGLNEILLPVYLGTAAREYDGRSLLDYFYERKVNEAMITLKATFASVPYHELVFNKENVWHASFLSMMRIMGADIIGEAVTNIGRIDCVITCPDDIYIVEFKFNQSAADAILQIREKKYPEPYIDKGKRIHLLGINFSTEEKNIVEWKEEEL